MYHRDAAGALQELAHLLYKTGNTRSVSPYRSDFRLTNLETMEFVDAESTVELRDQMVKMGWG